MDEAGRGIDGARCADDDHQRGFGDLALDARHFERNLAEEDDVRAQAAAAGAAADLVEARVDGAVFDGRAAALALAAGFGQLAVHVDEIPRAGALVQVVDVLRAEKIAAGELRFKLGEGDVRGIGLGFRVIGAALGVERPDTSRIARQASGVQTSSTRMPGPQAV